MKQPRILRVNGQSVFDCGEHLHFHINEPMWSGGIKYGWGKDVWGLGIAEDIVNKAKELGRKLKLSYYKNRKYKYLITPTLVEKKAKEFNSYYMARNKTRLLVIPVNILEKEVINDTR